MVSLWMVGREEVPERSAEICVMEVFGDAVVGGESAAVGTGLHPFRDPDVREDFEAVRLPLDLAEFHEYACDWTSERVEFFVDGALVRRVDGPPRYPLQLMLAVFDFPERTTGSDADLVPELVVDWVRGYRHGPGGQSAG
jgi:beta-glucanase (GH16 family)